MPNEQPFSERGARVLFCTDFSPTADRAFDYAADAARRRPGAELILLHVIPEPDAQFWKTYIYEVEDVDAKARRDVDAKIAGYTPRVPEGVSFRVEVRIGNTPGEILRLAGEANVHLIVLGRHGHTTFGEWMFGSVTDKVVRHARCPVLVVPPGE